MANILIKSEKTHFIKNFKQQIFCSFQNTTYRLQRQHRALPNSENSFSCLSVYLGTRSCGSPLNDNEITYQFRTNGLLSPSPMAHFVANGSLSLPPMAHFVANGSYMILSMAHFCVNR